MFTLQEAVQLAFLDLEESFLCTWRSGKGSKDSLIEAFSQREVPAYIYLGFKGSDGLRHAFARGVPDNDKPKSGNKAWEDWVLERIGCYDCSTCCQVHESLYDNPCKPLADIQKSAYNKERRNNVSEWLCLFLTQNPCSICSESDIRVLEFDHINPETKSFDIGNRGCKSLKLVQEEVAKCRVLCSNCHKKHTASTQNHYKHKYFSSLLEKNVGSSL